MTDLAPTRDKLFDLVRVMQTARTPNVVEVLHTLVEEMHQLAGIVNNSLQSLERNITTLDQRLTDLQITVGVDVEEDAPKHSGMPSLESFQSARKKAQEK